MGFSNVFVKVEPTRDEINALSGPTVLEFGTDWCGYCEDAQPLIAQAFAGHPKITHIKIEDGRGQALGRSFGIKLWPTLLFLKDGREVARLVRPQNVHVILKAMRRIER
ncbi:MAG: thioredoxin family protein [Smithella sp.]